MATKVVKNKDTRLTKRQRNILKMKEKLNTPDKDAIHPFTKYKIITYCCIILFPPLALYRIYKKDAGFVITEKVGQTMVCALYMLSLISIL